MIDRPDLPLFGLRPLAGGPQRDATDPRAGAALAGELTGAGARAGKGPDFEAWLADTLGARDYGGEIVHVERLSARAPRHADPALPLPRELAAALHGLGIE